MHLLRGWIYPPFRIHFQITHFHTNTSEISFHVPLQTYSLIPCRCASQSVDTVLECFYDVSGSSLAVPFALSIQCQIMDPNDRTYGKGYQWSL